MRHGLHMSMSMYPTRSGCRGPWSLHRVSVLGRLALRERSRCEADDV